MKVHQLNNKNMAQAEAFAAIAHNFFDKFRLKHCDEQVWELVNTYVSRPDGDLPMAKYRSGTIYFLHQVLKLLRELSKVDKENKNQSRQLSRA